MFSLFKALFGGLYYGGKYALEKSELKEHDKKAEDLIAARKEFQRQYGASFEMNKQTKEYILCGQHFEDICNSLAVELEDVLGKDWKQVIDIPNGYRPTKYKFIPNYHIYWVYHLLLAKKGKMDYMTMSSGYCESSIYTKERDYRFMRHIENNLRKANVPVTLVCEETDVGNYVKPDVMCTRSYHRLW